MITMRCSIAALTSAALLASSSLAFALPHHDAHHPGPAQQRAAEEHHKAVEEHKWGEAEKKKAEAWRDKYLRQLGRDRAKRQEAARAATEKQWGQEMWKHAEVKREMELDAWRLARIEALLALAAQEQRHDLITKLNELRSLEMARHNHLMDGYRTRWGHR